MQQQQQQVQGYPPMQQQQQPVQQQQPAAQGYPPVQQQQPVQQVQQPAAQGYPPVQQQQQQVQQVQQPQQQQAAQGYPPVQQQQVQQQPAQQESSISSGFDALVKTVAAAAASPTQSQPEQQQQVQQVHQQPVQVQQQPVTVQQVQVQGVDPEMARRSGKTSPGHLVYSAKMNQDKLECFYMWCCCMWCAQQTMARRTVVDIYTNGMQTNVPCGMCCCFWVDNSRYVYWDDSRFLGAATGKASCCEPSPCLCPHACHCFGDVLYFYRFCPSGCGWQACPIGIGHVSLCGGWFGLCGLCVTDLVCGMQDNEAKIVEKYVTASFQGNAMALQRPPYVPATSAGYVTAPANAYVSTAPMQ